MAFPTKELSIEEREIRSARRQAVLGAWKEEKQAVLQGKGSRDWTEEQQKQIVEKGSVHNFEGHHMRSVSYGKTQEEQLAIAGDKNNIQFLEKSKDNNEHLAAHNNNTRNPTNGYYDVKTGQTKGFGDKAPQSPPKENLTHPVYNKEQIKEQYDEYGVKINSDNRIQNSNKQEIKR